MKSLEPAAPPAEPPPAREDGLSIAQACELAEEKADAVVKLLREGGDTLDAARALLALASEDLWVVMALAQRPEAQPIAELLLRHYNALTTEDPGVPGFVLESLDTFEQPWFGELILLMVSLGLCIDSVFVAPPEGGELATRYPSLGAELAALLATPTTPERVRYAAATWLRAGDWPAATPALQAALREPRLRLRVAAGVALVRYGHVTAADTRFLLEEALTRRLPGDDCLLEFALGDMLVAAVKRAPCEEAPALLRQLNGRRGLWSAVAARTLAAAFPHDAMPLLAELASDFYPGTRSEAVSCLASLEPGLAAPLLAKLCQDPVPQVAQLARDTWLEQHTASPPPRLPVFGAALLRGEPSPRFELRLMLLRQVPLEGRLMVAQAIHAERPRGQARVERALLLLLAACDGDVLPNEKVRGQHVFCSLALGLCRELGPRLVDVVLDYIERFPASEWPAWSPLLTQLSEHKLLRPAHRQRVQAIAAGLLESASTQRNAVALLIAVGVPAHLVGPLFALEGRAAALDVARAVKETPRSRGLDKALMLHLDKALIAGDWRLINALVDAGHERQAPGLDGRLRRALRLGRAQQCDSLGWLVAVMNKRGLLPDDYFERALAGKVTEARWALEALDGKLSPRVVELVLAALDGPLAAPASRVVIFASLRSPTDPWWRGVLKRLPASVADDVLTTLVWRSPKAWRARVTEALGRAQGITLRMLCASVGRDRPRAIRAAAAKRPDQAAEMLATIGERPKPVWLDEDL